MIKNDQKNIETGLEIAIIGMSGKFPGAETLDRFWENLKNGVETISFFTCEELKEQGIDETLLNNPAYVKAYGVLTGKENFDAAFFGFSPKEAESMDPQIRLFMECSWEALEDAGYDSSSYKGAVGLYAGIADGFSWRAARMLKELRTGAGQTVHLLDTSLLLSTRVSHKLDLKGPSITLYTACSTSLVAVHQACRALLTGECDMALAGAVSAQPIDKTGYLYQEGMILSPDGHNRSFDAQAQGTIFGEGIGIVLLRRLKDALAAGDNIQCVIKASAVNNDGIGKSSYTAPGKKRIADVIRTALKLSRSAPENLSYVETHGTATALGDAIEMEALKDAFNNPKKAYCALGSVKSNIGHLDVAAGMAGLIKTVKIIQHRLIPASLYFETPNSKIDFIDSPFYINTALNPLDSGETPFRAGVCAFGIGGTNVFLILEEPPVRAESEAGAATAAVPQLLLLSARTDPALGTMVQNLAEYLKNNPALNLADVAYTLQVGRKTFSRRRMFICTGIVETIAALADNIDIIDTFPAETSPLFESLKQIGTDWLSSASGTIDWPGFYAQHPEYASQKRRRISLPTYPFERQRYWIDGMGGDPLSAFSSLTQKGEQGEPGHPNTKIEKYVEEETSGLYRRPQLSTVYEPPTDEIEQALTGIWQRFFGIREVGIRDDFFELGGDSLKVITVVTEIHKQMDARVPIPQVFDTPTIKGLAGYIKSLAAGVDKYSAIEPIEEKEYYPLSSVQMRIYILQQLEVDSTGYNTPLLFILSGQVDRQRMENVFRVLVSRHGSLRTSFELIDGQIVQRIRKEVDFEIEYYPPHSPEQANAIIQSFIRPFDVACAPLLRVGLADAGNGAYLFMVDMHHSITDGSSIGILVREFTALYAGESLPELRIQYKDYTHWQNSTQQREAVKKQENYWLEIFAGELPVLNLPLDYTRPSLQGFAGNRMRFEISREEAAGLRTLAFNEDVTLFMVLLSLYYILLAKICGQEDIVIGTPTAGRNHADLQRMIGMLVNTLALRNAPAGEKPFTEFVKEVKKNTLAAFQNQDYLFEDLVEQVTRQMNRDVSRNPIFDTIFNLLNFESQYEKNVQISVPGLTLRPYEYERGIAIFDLTLEAVDTGNGITFNFEFSTKLFKPETIERFIRYFKKIVTAVAAAPDQTIAQIEIFTEADKQQILHDCSGPEEEFAGEPLIHHLFQRRAEKTPDQVALLGVHALNQLSDGHELREMTYGELHEKSNKLARVLLDKGAREGDIIGIMLPRSHEMVIAVLAILKAGGAYLPIDPELPGERVNYMLKDSEAKILIIQKINDQNENHHFGASFVLNFENLNFDIVSNFEFRAANLNSSNLIYLIYTSGSTGRPKGVFLEHRNVHNLLLYQYRYTHIDFSRVLQFTTISFDVSFQEIFSTLLAGGLLLLADKEIIRDFPRLFKIIEQNDLKTLFLPASFLKFVFNLEEYTAIFPTCIKHIVTAGEQLIVTDYLRTYLKTNGVYLHNHYGPSETHVVTALTLDPANEIPALPTIGKPLANTAIYIVDKESHLLPLGIAGELLIGGVQVGCGYLNNPELTAEKFINFHHSSFDLPRIHHSIFYRTGDLARWLPDGNIEFLGRIDFQVKIRGYRIELGEIESHLLAAGHVKEAVVIAGKDPRGETYLCAYIVSQIPGQGNKETLAGLRNNLAHVLPEYMMPSYFMYLDKIPLTANGKVNRKALPEPVIENEEDYRPGLDSPEVIISEAERRKILDEFNAVEIEYPRHKTIHKLFAEQSEKTADHIAVFSHERTLSRANTDNNMFITYRELNEKSAALAGYIRDCGVMENNVVGIMLERSTEMIIGILGILKSGCAYLPINPAFPRERIQFMLMDSGARIIIIKSEIRNPKFEANSNVQIIMNFENLNFDIVSNFEFRAANFNPSNLAYIIYTSGSTGKPKGVPVTHANLLPLLHWGYLHIGINEKDRVIQNLSYYFDWSVWEIFITLTTGAGLFMISEEILLNPEKSISFIRQHGITVLHITPTQYRYYLATGQKLGTLRYLFIGAEPLSVDLAKRSIRSVDECCRIFNMYGPTEATIIASVLEIKQSRLEEYEGLSGIPIGSPVGNTKFFILNERCKMCPIDVTGELYIGGDGVAQGYLNNPDLTAEKFNRSYKYHNSYILYKTGDLARWLPDGNVEFLGRVDFQVKIRGYRIELGEIESRLMAIDYVKEAVVIPQEDGSGEKFLCAYVVTDKEIKDEKTSLRNILLKTLPDYMVPVYFISIAKLPLTPNGKVDIKALPLPTAEAVHVFSQGETFKIRTREKIEEIETKLAALWAEVLGIDRRIIRKETNFFEIGGHSLKATLLTGKIHKEIGVHVPLAEIFKNPTIKGLTGYIKGAKAEAFFAVEPVEKREYYPLSSAQRRLYVLQQMDLGSAVYNMPSAMIAVGEIDIQKLANTFYRLIRRHESFRTSFITVNDEPVQRVYQDIEFKIAYDEFGVNDPAAKVSAFIRPFDLSLAPLLRVGLSKLEEEKHLLMIDIHHIISDGISIRTLIREFVELYRDKTLSPLRLQYKDYAAWQNSQAGRLKAKDQEKYWLNEFSGEVAVLSLPNDFPRPVVQSFAGSNLHFELGVEITTALNKLALEQETTLFMVLASIFNLLLAKLSGQEDIVIGVPTAGRKHADLQHIIGIFVNTLALRNFPVGSKTFKDFLQEVVARTLKAFENEDCQFEELVDKLALKREADRNPLFDVMFAMLNRGEQKLEKGSAEKILKMVECEFETKVSRFDMSWNTIELSNRLDFTVEYSTRLFKRETIERFTTYFKKIIETVIAAPGCKIAGIDILAGDERQRILCEFNNTAAEYPHDKTIHELFAEWAQTTPDHLAVVEIDSNACLTYRHLNERSDRLAMILIKKGVLPGHIIGIMIKRSTDMIIGLLGILKSGGAYLPIDPGYPEERIDYMLKDSKTKILLTANEITSLSTGYIFNSHHSSFIIHHSSHLAYIIYTSGTTGRPKGVMAEHRGVVRLVKNTNYLIFNRKDRILPTGGLEFDISTFETWGPLLNGLSMYLAAKEVVLDTITLKKVLTRYDIAILHLIPQLFNRAVDQDTTIFQELTYLLVGGDRVNRETVETVRKHCPGVRILHMYGPTENTTFSSYLPVEREYNTSLPIGRPIANSTVYLLDKYEYPVPLGVIGELWVGGVGVARGYLNNPELTAEKFKRAVIRHSSFVISSPPNHFTNDQCPMTNDFFYRTGDLARWLPDPGVGGAYIIEFLGRSDHQVKVRGIRVELGEIENSLLKHNGVKEAVVVDREDEEGETYLCAYIVPAGEGIADAELREFLTAILPRNMIPAYFIPLEKIPVTTVGKINKKALPEPLLKINEAHSGPVDKIEAYLVETWSYVLSLPKEKIARHINFFALGGHSLKATVLLARIHKELDVKIPLAELFKTPTIKGLAEYIRSAKEEAFFALEAAEEREYYPLSSAQRRLYLLQQMDLNSVVYNMPLIMMLDKEIAKDHLERIIRQIIQRHESFRTSFETVNEELVQKVHHDVDFDIEYYELETIDQATGVGAFISKFDLSRAPLLRVKIITLAGNKYILIVDMHHIISDGFSMDILLREFPALYEGEQLPPLRIQYKDYTYWQNSETVKAKIKDQEEFWMKELRGDIPILDLPFDYPRPQVQSFQGSFLNFAFNREETLLLKKAAIEGGVTLYLLLVTIFNIFLYKLSGQEDIVLGTPIAGRRHADLQAIVGMFVNTLLLRNFPAGEKNFVEFLEEVKTRTLRAFENQDYQFEDLVEKVAVGRDPGRNPLFDVMFTWQEQANKKDDSVSRLYEGQVSRFDMTWFASEKNDCISLGIEYCTQLFKPETIMRFSGYFKKIAAQIIVAPGAKIAEIDFVPEEEKKQLLYAFNHPDTDYPGDKTIAQLFAAQVERTPDHMAIFSHGRTLLRTNTDNNRFITYRQLGEQSGRLAEVLAARGIQPGEIAGIMLERSIEMIIGILGILKSGCAYLPINPGFPQERIDYMLKDSAAKILLTEKDITSLSTECVSNSHHSSFIIHHLSHFAYIIYTSGSTGKPKGVPITYANLSPLLHWGYRHLEMNEKDRAIQNLSYYFDWSVWEIFITLTTGAGLFMITEELLLNPEKSAAFIQQHAITILHVTPTQYRYYLASGRKLETLRYLFLGAEALSLELAKRSLQSVDNRCRVFNMYGPTEATIIASVLEIERSRLGEYKGLSAIPIGSTVGNTQFLILDKHFNLCPLNVTGELYIGGDGLAQGYLNNPELTAERFSLRRPGALFEKTAPGPHKNFLLNHSPLTTHHSPLYKTGDLARWLPDGNVEFLGRGDFQVKIRGYRIELGEIENKLAEHPGVREAVVLALNMAPNGKDTGEKYLCAYVVPGSPGILNTAELKEFLSHSLPDYMIPSYFTAIDSIPLNPNGKVDWRALPDPGIEVSNNYEAPRNDTERKLVDIWSEILALDKGAISIHDDFFARGGHSLKAAVLVSKIQKEFSIVVPLVEVFKTPTVKGLGEHIGSNVNKGESILPALEDENLVLLRRNTPGIHDIVPLFFIHSGSGEIEAYIELCSRLHGRYNCWGLRVNRVDRMKDFVPRDLAIPELAAQYIKAIKKIQPTGPYFIIGWCVGGTIAFEMNRQLEQSGEKPGTLCLVNAYAPFNKYKGKISTFNIATELSFLKFLKTPLGDKQLKKELKNAVDIPQIWQKVVNYCEERKVPIEILKKAIPKNIVSAIPVSQDASNLDQTKQELREFIYYVNIIRSLGFAREIYNPLGKGANTSKNNADVYFFGASQSAIANKNQWAGYFEKPVKFYEIEGDHFSIFKIPHVIAFSEEFNRLFYNEQTIRN